MWRGTDVVGGDKVKDPKLNFIYTKINFMFPTFKNGDMKKYTDNFTSETQLNEHAEKNNRQLPDINNVLQIQDLTKCFSNWVQNSFPWNGSR